MNCQQFENEIFGYLEGTLPDDTYRAAHAHLKDCRHCQAIATGWEKIYQAIEKERTMEVNPFAGTRIMQRLEEEVLSKRLHRPAWTLALRPLALAMAVSAGILMGAWQANRFRQSGNQPGMHSATEIENLRNSLFIHDFSDEDQVLVLKN